MASTAGLDASFFTTTASIAAERELSDSDSESELGELLRFAFRLRPFTKLLTVGFCEVAGLGSCAPASSFSSSASSLSELEVEVDFDGDLIFDDLLDTLLDFRAGDASFIMTSESLPLSMLSLPLLLVTSFTRTLAAAASLALASASTSFFT